VTIECYYNRCSYHSYNTRTDDGPFCYEPHCRQSPALLAFFEAQRQAREDQARHIEAKPPVKKGFAAKIKGIFRRK
jgi:hypothetical protein